MPYLRDISRSPVQWGGNYSVQPSSNKLYLANVPRHWTVQHIIKFIKDVTKSIMISQDIAQVNIFEDEFRRSKGTCMLQFDTSNVCKAAFGNLQGIVCEGKKLLATLEPDPQFEYFSGRHPTEQPETKASIDHNKSRMPNTKLYVANFPLPWGPEQIAKYIELTTNSTLLVNAIDRVQLLRDEGGNGTGQCVLHFSHPDPCKIAYNELKVAMCQGSRLTVNLYDGNEGMKDTQRRPPADESSRLSESNGRDPLKSALAILDRKDESYGLNQNFLKHLNIKPPLYSSIFVGNLSDGVDEAKLHEVMSFAGTVLRVKIKGKSNRAEKGTKIATVEFDHPLEAVQAISMFHGKSLLGMPMIVCQHKNPQKKFLPEGLQGLGPGLGPNGEPLKGVRYAVQVEPHTKFLIKQIETLTNELEELRSKLKNANTGTKIGEANMNSTITPMVAPVNSFQSVYSYNPVAMNQAQAMMTSAVQPMMGQDVAMTMQTMPNQNLAAMPVQAVTAPVSNYAGVAPMMAAPITDPNVVASHWNAQTGMAAKVREISNSEERKRRSPDYKERPRYESDHKRPKNISDMLIFKNIPRNVTEDMLRSKMQEVGEIKMVELTGGGRALVRYSKEADAERCKQIFHHSKVDGQIIEVDYF